MSRSDLSETPVSMESVGSVPEHASYLVLEGVHLVVIQDLQVEFVVVGSEQFAFKMLFGCLAIGVGEESVVELDSCDVALCSEVANEGNGEGDIHALDHLVRDVLEDQLAPVLCLVFSDSCQEAYFGVVNLVLGNNA